MTDETEPAILEPTRKDLEGEAEHVSLVRGLEVRLSKNRRSILLELTPHALARFGAEAIDAEGTYALSPPAAKRLSRLLKRAVRDYLKSPDHKSGKDSEG